MDIIDNEQHKNKKIKIEPDQFVLNTSTTNYKCSDPNELIIINTSYDYCKSFYQLIIDGGTKSNVVKIITSDLVIVKYFIRMEKMFVNFFPNCKTIEINSFSNDYYLISTIIDTLLIVENIVYKLNDCVFINNSMITYKNFSDLFFTGNLTNIKNVKIINNIDDNETDCSIEKKIIMNIISHTTIENKNKYQYNYINKYQIDESYINNIYLEYKDNKRSIYFSKYVLNIKLYDLEDL